MESVQRIVLAASRPESVGEPEGRRDSEFSSALSVIRSWLGPVPGENVRVVAEPKIASA
jgi:hypothetical protein